ncbi:excisionase family DNA-binding protein [Maribellus comscasis]|uniref:Excisionase family DNA-binding protein n=1 Tax=Maribellus comscasis TaxID=2681766 RepID=A0A6I6K0Z6_9BACT|nr:helix-turn-helix domain-containing protein [Maribellus comscasis]QGY47269.1 excisionase family DNA-binding protein [Maribellus comscasis]
MNEFKIAEKLDRIERLIISNKKVLTFDEACEYTGLSRSYLYKLTSSGRIPFSKPNGKIIFFEKEKLDNWLLQNSHKSDDEIEEESLSYIIKKKKA